MALTSRVVNGYAPTDANGTDDQKQLFYSQLRKAAVKTQKHQKLIVTGDFNATTSIAKHRCFFEGKKVTQGPECSDNGTHLKTFFQTMNYAYHLHTLNTACYIAILGIVMMEKPVK